MGARRRAAGADGLFLFSKGASGVKGLYRPTTHGQIAMSTSATDAMLKVSQEGTNLMSEKQCSRSKASTTLTGAQLQNVGVSGRIGRRGRQPKDSRVSSPMHEAWCTLMTAVAARGA